MPRLASLVATARIILLNTHHRTISKRIALLEDDPEQSALVVSWLEDAGYCCQAFSRSKALLSSLGRESYDLIILDWHLPDMEGSDVLLEIRGRLECTVPVLFTTSRDSEADIVHVLERGADDYLVKPIRHMEFLARLNALFRRNSRIRENLEVLDFGAFTIDLAHRAISKNGKIIELTDKEYDLALFLFQNAGRLLSRGHVLESVWGRNPDLDTRTVDVHISRIRRKLQLTADSGWRLTTIYQHGYRLESVNQALASEDTPA
jgi:DNA-binding response OmpR family regulator